MAPQPKTCVSYGKMSGTINDIQTQWASSIIEFHKKKMTIKTCLFEHIRQGLNETQSLT